MKKIFIDVILIVALVLTLTINVFAVLESSVTINNITDKQTGDTFNITGTSTSTKVLIRIQNHDGDIIGSNVASVNANVFSSTFTVPANKGTGLFKVLANNEDGSASNSATFNVVINVPVTGIAVTDIVVASAGDKVNVLNGGTLQMDAVILPDTATNKAVTWSVTNGTGSATISSNGLLVATAVGTIIVKATANDGSGVSGTKSLTVNAQTDNGITGGAIVAGDPGTISAIPATGQIQANVDPQGSATAQVSTDNLKSAIDNAVNGTAKIEVTGANNAKYIRISLPPQQLFAANTAKIDTLEVNAGLAQISIKTDILKNADGSVPANVNITITKVDSNSLTTDVKSKVGNNQVYEFTLSADGNKISSFSNNEVKVGIKYTFKQGENPNNIVIYYIGDSGTLEVVINARYNADTGMAEFTPAHFSKYAAAYVSVTYKDIGGVSWAKESIEALAARGIIGNAGGAFNPSANITRADFLDMVIKASNLLDNNAVCTFKDVDKKASYYQSMATAQKLGITLGTGKGSFEPNTVISRQDMAVMLYRIASKASVDISGTKNAGTISDKSSLASYAVDAVSVMYKTGLLNGTGNGMFSPKSTTTRAQGAVVAFNMFKRIK
jgi:hypothetical protein